MKFTVKTPSATAKAGANSTTVEKKVETKQVRLIAKSSMGDVWLMQDTSFYQGQEPITEMYLLLPRIGPGLHAWKKIDAFQRALPSRLPEKRA